MSDEVIRRVFKGLTVAYGLLGVYWNCRLVVLLVGKIEC